MGKLIVELPDEIHNEIKKKATLYHQTIKDIVTELLEDYLFKSEEKKEIKETGLCGKWEDIRKAEAIIQDIKGHRKWFERAGRKGA